MKPIDDATLDRLIEHITRNVLVLLQEEGDPAAAPAVTSGLSPHHYVDRGRPVAHAGADRIGSTLGAAPVDGQLAEMIDHTLLKPDASQDEIARLCFEARKYHFASVDRKSTRLNS